jgi:hypothetical protein
MKERRGGIGTASPVVFGQLYEGKKGWHMYIVQHPLSHLACFMKERRRGIL